MEEVDERLEEQDLGPRVRKPSQYVRDILSGLGTADGRPGQPQFPVGLQVPEERAEDDAGTLAL